MRRFKMPRLGQGTRSRTPGGVAVAARTAGTWTAGTWTAGARTAGTRATGALAAGALALAGVGLAGPARAAYLGSEGRIAFVRSGDIYSIEPTGAGLRLLAGGGHDSGPRWAPNGSRLAYLDDGNLWIMNANGSHKRQITSAAPGLTDGRPTWSPSGRYLAFVQTARSARLGYLTRYDTVTGRFAAFTTTISPPGLIDVTARPGTAVAWARAIDNVHTFGYFIIYEGAGRLCRPHWFCLNALGLGHESQVGNGFPSAEDQTPAPTRLTDPDWFPIIPRFDTDVLTTVESCTSGGCAHIGIELQILGAVILPGGYQAVYSPIGRHIAFVRDVRGRPEIYTTINNPATAASHARLLTAGRQPDWQPVSPFPPS